MAKSAVAKQRFVATGNADIFMSNDYEPHELSTAVMIDGKPLVAFAIDADDPSMLWLATLEPDREVAADLKWVIL